MDEKVKPCACCGKVLPLTTEYYHRNQTRKCGYSDMCKRCAAISKEKSRRKFVKARDNNSLANEYCVDPTYAAGVCPTCGHRWQELIKDHRTGPFCSRTCARRTR